MVARLQKLITLGALAAASLWGLLAWQAGRPILAVVGMLVVIGGYALVLGVEFICVARINQGDPAPYAGTGLLLRAWWGEIRSAPLVFCWRQPFRSRRWPDALHPGASGRRGVLLIHGFICNRGLWNRWLQRLDAEQVQFVAVNLEPVFGAIDDYVGIIERAVQRLEQATGMAPIVVAHSMGGLALRRWWVEPGNVERVHHAITIGTPHRGTWLARFALTPNGRQMRIDSAWLQAIAAREPVDIASRMTCYYGHCDNIVLPATTATMSGAVNHHLAGTAHVHMADHPAPLDELLRRITLSGDNAAEQPDAQQT